MDAARNAGATVLALAVLTMAPAVTRADDQEELRKIWTDPVHQQHLVHVAGLSTVLLQNPCPAAQFALEDRFIVYERPVFDAANGIVAGAWKRSVVADGCGAKRVLNVIVRVSGPNSLSVTPALPGTTHADPVLQKDAVKIVVSAAATAPGAREPGECHVGYVADTEFIERETGVLPGARGPSWRERWTLVSCTRRIEVPVRFIPDATGTSISAGPSTDVKVVPIPAEPR
jgi:hypothetical protein